MYVGLKQPLGDGERCVTSARAAAKETSPDPDSRLPCWASDVISLSELRLPLFYAFSSFS